MPRVLKLAAFGVLCLLLTRAGATAAPADKAPAPRAVRADDTARARLSAADTDKFLMDEIKARAEIMKNLRYVSDEIGGRLTGSPQLEKANKWTAEKMKEYGLENVRLEPWEVPYGWQRGKAEMKVVEPDTGRSLIVASAGWSPGTKGKVTGDVVIIPPSVRTTKDLEQYKGKLKNATILRSPPTKVAPISDLNYLGSGGKKDEPKKEEGKKDAPKKEPVKDDAGESGVAFKLQPPAKEQPPKKDEGKKDEPKKEEPKGGQPKGGGFGMQFQNELNEFLKAEGAACVVSDSGKPHGLLVTTGGWRGDRAAAEAGIARVFMAHEHYDLLYRLASREKATTRVEVEIENKFIPGPVVVYNTIGEVRGSEKPDEVVVVGAHLDSWDLAQGTTDNGTGSCVVLETARVVAKLAKAGSPPKRTIRFCLFTGEEQGLWGSRKYVEKYKEELSKHSLAIVHDTGTGKVTGFGLEGRTYLKDQMEGELAALKGLDGWKGLTSRGIGGGTDHYPFHTAGVPGFACNQDMDEYRLTHHTQSDTFDKAKEPNLIQGAQVMAVTAVRIANLPELLPRK